jgi:hypothetical protein
VYRSVQVLYTPATLPGRAYTCTFTDEETGLFAASDPIYPPALEHAPLLATSLLCVAPLWPHGEAPTAISIADESGKAVVYAGGARVAFVMAASWRGVAPSSAFARGGAVLTFSGQVRPLALSLPRARALSLSRSLAPPPTPPPSLSLPLSLSLH